MSLQIFYNGKSVIYTHIVLAVGGGMWKWVVGYWLGGLVVGGLVLKEISRMQRQLQSALGKYE